jgi:integrase
MSSSVHCCPEEDFVHQSIPRDTKAASQSDARPDSLAELLPIIATWTDISQTGRRVLDSNIHTCGRIALTALARKAGRFDALSRHDIRLEAIACDVPSLNEQLFCYSHTVFGLSAASKKTAVSGLRRVLRRIGLVEPHHPPPLPRSSHWLPLVEGVDHELSRSVRARFASWCEANSVGPEDVWQEILLPYGEYVRTYHLQNGIQALLRATARWWNHFSVGFPDWSQVRLTAPALLNCYTFKLTTFPSVFQDEVHALGRHLRGSDQRPGPFQVKRIPALREATVEMRLYYVGAAASILVLQGRRASTITSLADLVTEDSFRQILQFYWDRAAQRRIRKGEITENDLNDPTAGNSGLTENMSKTLLQVAKYWCHVEPDQLKALSALAQAVRPPKQTGITVKNSNRLAQLDDPSKLRKLLLLPETLMALAESIRDRRPVEAARLAGLAAAIELLLNIPLRLRNLARLRIGINLKYTGARGGLISRLVVSASETKNRQSCEWSVGEEPARILERYIRSFLPTLESSESRSTLFEGRWLFPGRPRNQPIDAGWLGMSLTRVIEEHTGLIINTHLFRSLAAKLQFEDAPGGLEDLRLLLGDKSPDTVLRHYAAFAPDKAARRYEEVLKRTRAKIEIYGAKLPKRSRKRNPVSSKRKREA